MEHSERLQKVLEYKKISAGTLEVEVWGKNGSRLNKILAGQNKMTTFIANKITEYYPDISYMWLLKGEGEMIQNEKAPPIDEDAIVKWIDENFERLYNSPKMAKMRQIIELRAINDFLRTKLREAE